MNMKIITSGLITLLLLSGIADMTSADTDTLLEHGEKAEIQVSFPQDLSANDEFTIEIKPPTGATLSITRTAPAAIYSVMNLHFLLYPFMLYTANEVIHTSVGQATSSVELAGDVIGLSADGEHLTGIIFYLSLTAGQEPVDLNEMIISYTDKETYVAQLTPMKDKPLERKGQWNYSIFGEAIPTPHPTSTPIIISTPTPPPEVTPTPTPTPTSTSTPIPTKAPIGKPQLTVSQTTLREEPEVGEDVLITVTISNTGDGIAKNINLREHIPSSVSVNYVDGANSAGNLITWSGDMDVGQTYSIIHSFRILEEKNRAVPVKVTYEDEKGKRYETSATIYISAKDEETPAPTPLIPGFEAVFAIAGLLAVAYLIRIIRRSP